ncbi:LysR family transcriptional regulator [Frigidibacter oleivorans]|uniref:LysR family transcriptional regulator n=1 Tax=Frigidibacter oleivorans TaxID=2487129 RepID=UPI000F8D69F4|nr:LysR family transcriptional regulator [Frigidibacter oleivorans]
MIHTSRKRCDNNVQISIRHLRFFVITAEQGSFRRASIILETEQSTVSRRVRTLEDLLGVSLFHRQTSGVSLTYAGRQFLPRARRIIRILYEGAIESSASGRSEEGILRIGLYSSMASGFLASVISDFAQRHESIRLEFIEGAPGDLVASIRQLNLDIAVTAGTRYWENCDQEQFWSECIYVAIPDRHFLSGRELVTWHDLSNEVLMVSDAPPGEEFYKYIVRQMGNIGVHPTIRTHNVVRDNLLPLVAIGQGLTIVGEAITIAKFPGVVYRPIANERMAFSAVWSMHNDNPALRRFLSTAREYSIKWHSRTA